MHEGHVRLRLGVRQTSDLDAKALAAYSEKMPNVVLMDVRMPILDGLAATRQIRKLDPAARIIIVTDCDDEETRAAASEAGASGYVLKQDLTTLETLIGQSPESTDEPA